MSSDHYRTIADRFELRLKIERSEFLGLAFPVTTDDAFFAELQTIEKHYFNATHHCWAFRIRSGEEARARSSDAGEPSGTAGKPILSAVEGADLFDLGVVVVRWFGGIKLGTGGLSRAYRETAALTLAAASRVERFLYEQFRVVAPFDAFGNVYRLVSPPDVVLTEEVFGETTTFTFDVRRSMAEAFARSLTGRRLEFTRGR